MRFMQLSLNCVDPTAVWRVGPRPAVDALPEDAESLVLANAPLQLRRATGDPLYFAPTQLLRIVPNEAVERREFRMSTLAYIYVLSLDPTLQASLLEWHYHPHAGRPDTHLHVRGGSADEFANLHIPTGRVSFESLVRFLITDMGVADPHDRWEEILDDCERRFRKHATWP